MSAQKIHLVPSPCVATGLSEGEEARALSLADVALRNTTTADADPIAGDRAKTDHQRLVEELRNKVDEIENGEPAA